MRTILVCRHCLAQFEPRHTKQVYCSNACRLAALHAKGQGWNHR